MPDQAYTVAARLQVPGFTVETRNYSFSSPYQEKASRSEHVLSLSLSPRTAFSQCAYEYADHSVSRWVDTGDVIFAPAGVSMLGHGAGGDLRRVCCVFDADKFSAVTGFDGQWDGRELEAGLDIRAATIKTGLYQLASEVTEPGFASALLIESLGNTLLVELARYLKRALQQPAAPHSKLAPWQLRRITDYVESLVDPAPTVTQLAELCNISARHLRRAFRQTSGQAISEYVREVRLLKAKNLLTETNLSLKEIAYRLGFSSPSSFSVAFHKATGETPKIFRLDRK
jgi:AraC family transcriptional regulator